MRYWHRAAMGLILLGGAGGLRAQAVTAVPHLDHVQYAGTWYEIAHYPTKRTKRCASDRTHLVAEGDKASQLQFVEACKVKAGFYDANNITAKAQDKKVQDGRFKITTLWPLSRKYWVLAVGPDWSLSGSPNRKELYVYSRTLTMNDAVLAEIKAKADAMGFNSGKLVMVPQSGH
jgi:apolipoprotein D and lipocalin family protein